MSREWQYLPGNYWCICDECGFKFRRKEMRLRWDNLWVCGKDWETRQPQDFVTARIDVITVDPIRPVPAATYTGPTAMAEYLNDAAAAVGGVSVGSPYISSTTKDVKIRIS